MSPAAETCCTEETTDGHGRTEEDVLKKPEKRSSSTKVHIQYRSQPHDLVRYANISCSLSVKIINF